MTVPNILTMSFQYHFQRYRLSIINKITTFTAVGIETKNFYIKLQIIFFLIPHLIKILFKIFYIQSVF